MNTVDTSSIVFSLTGESSSTAPGTHVTIGEAGSGSDTAAVLTGSVTIIMDPGMKISSDKIDATAGLFGTAVDSGSASSIITLGGAGGYKGFDPGDTIIFDFDLDLDAIHVEYGPIGTLTDTEQAELLASEIEKSYNFSIALL